MQDGASSEVNNAINDNLRCQDRANGHAEYASNDEDVLLSQLPNIEPQEIVNGVHHTGERPKRGRKRKVVEHSPGGRSRHVSPPWKKVAVEGPTSFIEDGRRKSSRTNAVPLELQPPAGTRQTRAGHLRKSDVRKPTKALQSASKFHDPRDAYGKRPSTPGNAQPFHSVKPNVVRTPQSLRHQGKAKVSLSQLSPGIFPPISPEADRREIPSQSPDESRSRRKRRRSSNHLVSRERITAPGDGIPVLSPIVYRPIKSLRLNFRPPPLPILHPGNIIASKRYPTLKDLLIEDDPLEGEDERKHDSIDARREASVILRLEEAAKPGGLLSEERWTGDAVTAQEEPPGSYTHPDYLLKHVVDFQPRLERERAHHIALAKRLAQLALAEWKRRQPQTEEEKWAQKRAIFELNHKRLLKEFEHQWDMVRAHVKQQKLAQFMEEQDAQTKQELKKMLDKSSQLVMERRRARTNVLDDGSVDEEMQQDHGIINESSSENESLDDSSESSLSDSESSESNPSGSEGETEDNILSREELLQKYGNLPDIDRNLQQDILNPNQGGPIVVGHNAAASSSITSNVESHTPEGSDGRDFTSMHESEGASLEELDPKRYELEVVAEELLDASDEDDSDEDDVDDSEDDDDDEEESSDDDDDDEISDEELDSGQGNPTKKSSHDLYGSLLGFYDPKQQQKWHSENPRDLDQVADVQTAMRSDFAVDSKDVGQAIINQTITGDNNKIPTTLYADVGRLTPSFNSTSEDASRQLSPATTHTGKPSEADSMTSPEPCEEVEAVIEKVAIDHETPKTEVSSLLRGDLRVYQHAGVDWLAGMYANRTNGILADEMGLGKTIQTIALLSHLATAHHVWGPHLVVVPTSVMLNWEMEFKKWCPGFKILTYYGTQEERRIKRRGWLNDDQWHVCITSYQLALQDQISLRRRNWHYMVLDEAHNIKNFRSQRWQTLLTFKTEARLLLTGTPLQNNLDELWSLLFFLEPGQTQEGETQFADLKTFSKTFHKPVDQILEHGREELDEEGRELVTKLHKVLRPHLLRRLKADVEKQMPKKYEHIVKCRLSKRQRQLYDGYMGLADTRESFQSGNYLSIINCLMQLRKVCNHPDLFETRQIVTSYAMPKSAIAEYEIRELLIRKRILNTGDAETVSNGLFNLWHPNTSTVGVTRGKALAALGQISEIIQQQEVRIRRNGTGSDLQTVKGALSCLISSSRQSRLTELHDHYQITATRTQRRPVYTDGLLKLVKLMNQLQPECSLHNQESGNRQAQEDRSDALQDMVITIPQRSGTLDTIIKKFTCVTPAVIAPGLDRLALTDIGMVAVGRAQEMFPIDPFHEARTRLAIAFPDKGLIQYDCGKLQALDRLLRNLQAGGHRALIFTQMTKVLDILEQFLNLHGHLYLRLDGSTKIEQRQILTDRFNNDNRILTFILSSRSGGLGINLTGADTVIFYDLDWNPAMDKQCQDRCHRIGQTRDVHIYRFVSEGTIEANILRKSNQKRMLDDVVIQEGDFTTDYFNKIDPREFLDDNQDADAALDKVLGNTETRTGRVFEQAEDKEDIEAATEAQKEYVQTDDADFDDKIMEDKTGSAGEGTPRTDQATTPLTRGSAPPSGDADSPVATVTDTPADGEVMQEPEVGQADEGEPGSHEEFMLRHIVWELRDVVIRPPSDRAKKKAKKGKDHSMMRIRR